MVLQPGSRLGSYEVQAPLGAGGMGTVYRSFDTILQRPVAVKVLSEAEEQARGKLLAEARAASSLSHPNVCHVYEVSEHDGQPYIVMELVEGKPLSELIPSDGLPPESVIRYGLQIADALAHAHENGIIHRDLKSQNVVITPEGRAKVLDFGLAMRLEKQDAEAVTVSMDTRADAGRTAGTLAYMAPEVLRREKTTARSDIWALGVLLYQIASGRLPFEGKTGAELTSAILRDPAPPLPDSLPALSTIVTRCLAKEPAQRYPNAGEVRAALETLGPVGHQEGRERRPSRRLALVTAVASLAALVAVGWTLWPAGDGGASSADLGPIRSLAVLPLDNLSGDADQEFFVDGMTEALIAELSQIGALKVISRTSVMQYKETQQALPEIARALGVDAVVEGSVLRAGDQVRVTAQLIQAATDELLWAERFDRELTNILALHSDVARAIAGEVRVALTPEEERRLTDRRAVDPAAYDAVLTGIYHLSRFPQGIEPATEAFERAIELDPTYARAYAGLASALSFAGYYQVVDHAETFSSARAAAEKALELDDSLAEAYTALGIVDLSYDWDWAAAESNLSRALELNPGSLDAHFWYGLYLVWVESRFDEGLALGRRAIELDPASLPTRMQLGIALYFTREFGEAIDLLTEVIDADSTYYEPYLWLAYALIEDGRYDEAIGFAQRLPAGPLRGSTFPLAYGLSGGREEVIELMAEEDRVLAERPSALLAEYSQYLTAAVYGAVGEHDLAFEALERAYERREPLFNQFRVDPRMDSLRDDPRFDDFVARMNYP